MPTQIHRQHRSPLKKRFSTQQYASKRSPSIKKMSSNQGGSLQTHKKKRAAGIIPPQQREQNQKEPMSPQATTPLSRLSPSEKQALYYDVSANGQGRERFLRMRRDLSPKERFLQKATSQHDYGWFMDSASGKKGSAPSLLVPPRHGHVSKTKREFYRERNGVPLAHAPDSLVQKPNSPEVPQFNYQTPQYGRKKKIQTTFFEYRQNKREYGKDYIFPPDQEFNGADRFEKFRPSDAGFEYKRPTENVRVRATSQFFSPQSTKGMF